MKIRIGNDRLVVVIVLIHIILFIFFAFETESDGKTFIGKFYRSKVVIGPFFMEERLRSSPHLMIRLYKEGWSDWTDVGLTYKRKYDTGPWNYTSLMKSEYVLHLAHKMASRIVGDSLSETTNFDRYSRAMHRLIVTDKWADELTDSVELAYSRWYPHWGSERQAIDTVWSLKYAIETTGSELLNK